MRLLRLPSWTDANSGSDYIIDPMSNVLWKCSYPFGMSWLDGRNGLDELLFSKPSLTASLFCRTQSFFPSYYWFHIFLEHFSRLAHINKISYLMFFFWGGGWVWRKTFEFSNLPRLLGVQLWWLVVMWTVCGCLWQVICGCLFGVTMIFGWKRSILKESRIILPLEFLEFYLGIYTFQKESIRNISGAKRVRCSWPRHLCLH